jgi:ABC-type branched-subunit amino acid transport system ATPase component
MTAAAPILRLRGVAKAFGPLRALDGVDLDVAPKSFHGLIGPNGSGKSTLLRAIAGEHLPDAGSIVFAGADITAATPNRRARLGLSIKFQITAVLRSLTVYDNLLLALQAAGPGADLASLLLSRTRRGLHAEVMRQLTAFRLAAQADAVAETLSHGQQQWLEIAMALAAGPRLLLLDEPTGGMSPEERRVTGELLRPIRQQCALVIVEHDLDFIKDLCDRLTVLDAGRVLDEGTPAEIEGSACVQAVYTRRA